MIIFILFLYHLQPSAAIPLPYRGSNSEEQGAPYGSYNYQHLQMPQLGPMYGFGLPHYSQMIQLQQALAQQPSPWQTQHTPQQNNRETLSQQIPSFQTNPQLPQQPFIPAPQPNYQHVTKQPLQLPPAPGPQMFLPFLNPGNPFWPQGNYFGYYGFGGRRPYNSEEANEDEEAAKEKEPPAAEPPVTESTNTTIDTNATVVEHGLGNSTAQNESFVGQNTQSPNVRLGGQSIYSSGVHSAPERHINILHGPRRPSNHYIGSPHHENIRRNQQQRYYPRVLTGHGDHPSIVPPTHHLPSEKRVFTTGELHSYGDKFSHKLPMTRESGRREILHSPTISLIRNGVQQHNGNNALPHRDFQKDMEKHHPREHSIWMGNKNNAPKRNFIIVPPERKEYFNEYSRQPMFEVKKQNIPRGIISIHHNSHFQPKSETPQQSIYSNQGNHDSQNRHTLLKTDDSYKQRINIDTWNKREITDQINTGDSVGPLQETIYLVSRLPLDHGNPTEQQGSLDYFVGNSKTIYPDNDLYGKTTTFHSENHNQHVNDFTTQFENFHVQPNSWAGPSKDVQGPLAEQNIRTLYITDDRYQNIPGQILLISKPGPLKTQEQLQFSTNGPSYHFKELSPGFQNPNSNLDNTEYIPEYGTNSQLLSIQYSRSKQFDPLKTDQFNHGEELHHGHESPVPLQMPSFPQTQPWVYNPEEIPSEQKRYLDYGSNPSGMRGQSSYQKKVGMDYDGSQHYTCILPFNEYDLGRGFPDSLLYVCCKLTYEQGSPSGAVDGTHEFRLTLKENKEWVPNQERIHRQHTRNVMDPPNVAYNRQSNSGTSNCTVSNTNENVMNSRREHSEGIPSVNKVFDNQNIKYPFQGLDDIAPCHARGDGNNYMYRKQVLNPENKVFTGNERSIIPPVNIQDDGSNHGGGQNDVRDKKGTGKLLRILTCPQVQMRAADMPASLDTFSLNNDIADGQSHVDTQDGFLHQLSGNESVNTTPDCLILNK